MSWNYRVVKSKGQFAIHEVFYREDGSVEGWTEEAVSPRGESIEELRSDTARYAEALERPVLFEDESGRLQQRA